MLAFHHKKTFGGIYFLCLVGLYATYVSIPVANQPTNGPTVICLHISFRTYKKIECYRFRLMKSLLII